MRGSKIYIGTQVVKAIPMKDEDGNAGYLMTYPEAYTTWMPKEVFEASYKALTLAEGKLIANI